MPKYTTNKRKFLLKKKFRHRASKGLIDLSDCFTNEDKHSESDSSSGYEEKSSPVNVEDGSRSSSISSPASRRSIFTQDTVLQDAPANITIQFRKLFPSSESEDEDCFLSTTTSSCSTLPELTVEPLPNPRKRKSDEDMDMKRLAYVTEKIRAKGVVDDWNNNFTKFSKKYFVVSFCKSNESHVRKYCEACTKKTEEEMVRNMYRQRHLKQKRQRVSSE